MKSCKLQVSAADPEEEPALMRRTLERVLQTFLHIMNSVCSVLGERVTRTFSVLLLVQTLQTLHDLDPLPPNLLHTTFLHLDPHDPQSPPQMLPALASDALSIDAAEHERCSEQQKDRHDRTASACRDEDDEDEKA